MSLILSGLTAGTLDILCAIFILAKGNAAGVFRFIAKGALGNSALTGGFEIIVLGVIFHYFIAFCFATGYFLVYPYISFLKKYPLLSGLFYGIFVWVFMQYLVLPMTHNSPAPVTFQSAWKSIVILMLALGLPISLITRWHYIKT